MKISAIQTLINQASVFTVAAVLAISSFAVALPLIFAPSAGAVSGSELIYDALPSIEPQTSYPGHVYEANATSQLADSITLGASNRRLETVTVTLNSGAKYSQYESNPAYSGNTASWSQQVTVNVYSDRLDENGEPAILLATEVQPFDIPWSSEAAVNGVATNVTLDFTDIYVGLPENIIVGVKFNTQNYGTSPTGVVGPYNALSVATPENQPLTVGTDANVDGVFLNSTYGTRLAGLKADTGWSPNGTLALRVTATEAVLATPLPTTDANDGAADGTEEPITETEEPSVIAEIASDFPAIINPSNFVGITVGNSQRSDSSDDEASAIRNNSTNTVRTTAATTSDSEANQGTFYGVGWYWWLLAIAALTSAAWWVGLANRNRQA